MTPTSLHCYTPAPSSQLTRSEQAILRVLRDARGFYRSSGLTAADVRHRLGRSGIQVVRTLNSLTSKGFAVEVAPDHFVLPGVSKSLAA